MPSLLLSALLAACGGSPAPTEAPPAEAPPAEAPAAPGGEAGTPAPGGEAPTAAAPPAAPPGPPSEPSATPGAVTTPSGGRPAPRGFTTEPATAVAIAGEVVWTGKTKGVLRLDVLHNLGPGQPPELMYTQELKSGGAFSVPVPPDAGTLTVTAYVDTNNNGPELSEPQARGVEVTVAGSGVAGIKLEVKENPDLSKTGPDGTKIAPPTP